MVHAVRQAAGAAAERSRPRRYDHSGGREHALWRLHAQSRGGAVGRPGRCQRARQPVGAARDGHTQPLGRQRRRPGGRARPRGLQGRRAGRRRRRCAGHRGGPGFPEAPRRGRLCRRQHHAALGLGLVGDGGRHDAIGADAVPLAVRSDCAPRRGLRRPALLPFRRAGAQLAAPQHGRADLARRDAGDGHEPLSDDARQ